MVVIYKAGARMFEPIVSKITTLARNVVRIVRETTVERPWIAPIAILAFFLIW